MNRSLTRGLAGAALLIGVLTVLARLAGFGRTLVFSQTVTAQCVGQVYNTANMIPNIVFEIVAGGALAALVVPVLAGPAERGAHDEVRRTASALVTWVVLLLLPLSLLAVVGARPLMRLLIPDASAACSVSDAVVVGADMLAVFAPQIVLYGIAVVLYGVLQAHRRFTGPALAPLMSSVVMMGAYLAFVPLGARHRDDVGALGRDAELTLSLGTTAGVAALVVTALIAARPLRLRLRPTLRFPPGVAVRVRGLALAGLVTVAAQQAATLAVIVLSWSGTGGALADYSYAWAVYLLPWAILAVPIATSAFPVLSARADRPREFDAITATTTRAVLLASCAGAALVAAVAVPVAHIFDSVPGTFPDSLAAGILAFAPGLLGYGLVAHLGRVLYACGHGRASAAATVTGWLAVLAADLVLVLPRALDGDAAWLPRELVVAAFGAGNTIGMTVAGVLLLVALGRARGRAALAGLPRAAGAGIAAALAAGAAGHGAAMSLRGAMAGGRPAELLAAVLAAVVAAVVFFAVAALLDRADLRLLARRRPASAGGDHEQERIDHE